MSYCREEGKDKIIFLTEEDYKEPSKFSWGKMRSLQVIILLSSVSQLFVFFSFCSLSGNSAYDIVSINNAIYHVSDCATGLIGANGEINWNCPCLGGMATGPCGVEFREAFSCFHYSKAEPRGSDCYESFQKMHECMQGYPELYGTSEEEDKEFEANMEKAEAESAAAASSSGAAAASSGAAEPAPQSAETSS